MVCAFREYNISLFTLIKIYFQIISNSFYSHLKLIHFKIDLLYVKKILLKVKFDNKNYNNINKIATEKVCIKKKIIFRSESKRDVSLFNLLNIYYFISNFILNNKHTHAYTHKKNR